MQRILKTAFQRPVVRRSLVVSAIVGTILNLINQSGAFFGDAPADLFKLVLNYLVPYCVSSYGAVSALLGSPRERT